MSWGDDCDIVGEDDDDHHHHCKDNDNCDDGDDCDISGECDYADDHPDCLIMMMMELMMMVTDADGYLQQSALCPTITACVTI